MAASALTATAINPTPPTNMAAGYVNAGKFTAGPPTADYAASVYNNPWLPGLPNPTGPTPPNASTSTLPPFLDDGASSGVLAYSAPASGTAAEGAGTEVVVVQTYSSTVAIPGEPPTPAAYGAPGGSTRWLASSTSVAYTNSPNRDHASSLTPATNPTLTSITLTSTASGAGNVTQTCTGVGFNKQSVVYVNGVAQPTTFVSSTSLTAVVAKKATAGTWPVAVVTGGSVVTAPQTWTFT